jgi:hypothetical protein
MEVLCFSEAFVDFDRTTRGYNSEDHTLHNSEDHTLNGMF